MIECSFIEDNFLLNDITRHYIFIEQIRQFNTIECTDI